MKTMSSRKIYLRPDEAMFKGVCAGIAQYLDVPVKLVRIITVLSMLFGLFMITLVAYAILAYWLEPAPAGEEQTSASQLTPAQQLERAELQMGESEQQLRQLERYVTSDTFTVQNRFRQL
ncbi:envelope stress response membrane protein PspC [Biostraticola tofi]|uniref:Phage shock protein C (PspC) family protein n=1 Tax=Biostraticola tofi TaxID=466109 RepID=A0A4R3Z3Y0_9GAMM|nr:envelope stress response membrane protein PspC [Biostraticola tofi]TCV99866.1 phage shock protein C (PspC) family protein [Biostraticola tofi]